MLLPLPQVRSTVLTPEEEAAVMAVPRYTLLLLNGVSSSPNHSSASKDLVKHSRKTAFFNLTPTLINSSNCCKTTTFCYIEAAMQRIVFGRRELPAVLMQAYKLDNKS
jgi:hypothetical protein